MKINGLTTQPVKVSPSLAGELDPVRQGGGKRYSQEHLMCPEFNVAVPAGSKKSTMAAYQFKDPKYTGAPHNPFQVQKDKGKPSKDVE